MRVGRREIDRGTVQAEPGLELLHGKCRDLPGYDERIRANDDAGLGLGNEGDGLDPYVIMDAFRGFPLAIPVTGEGQCLEFATFRGVLSGSESRGEFDAVESSQERRADGKAGFGKGAETLQARGELRFVAECTRIDRGQGREGEHCEEQGEPQTEHGHPSETAFHGGE